MARGNRRCDSRCWPWSRHRKSEGGNRALSRAVRAPISAVRQRLASPDSRADPAAPRAEPVMGLAGAEAVAGRADRVRRDPHRSVRRGRFVEAWFILDRLRLWQQLRPSREPQSASSVPPAQCHRSSCMSRLGSCDQREAAADSAALQHSAFHSEVANLHEDEVEDRQTGRLPSVVLLHPRHEPSAATPQRP